MIDARPLSDSSGLPDRLAGLVEDLTSPDPAVRDEGAFSALAELATDGGMDAHLVALGDRAIGLLSAVEVQARSFGALLVALVVDRDNRTSGAGEPAVRRMLDGVLRWYRGEVDTRGYDDDLGWLHAVAHGADALGELAASPRLRRDDLVDVLDALVRRASSPGSGHWLQDEDDRVSVAIMAVLRRDQLSADDVACAVDVLAGGWREALAGPIMAAADNSLRLARTLHLQLVLGVRAEPGAEVQHPLVRDQALRSLGGALAEVHWFYGSPE